MLLWSLMFLSCQCCNCCGGQHHYHRRRHYNRHGHLHRYYENYAPERHCVCALSFRPVVSLLFHCFPAVSFGFCFAAAGFCCCPPVRLRTVLPRLKFCVSVVGLLFSASVIWCPCEGRCVRALSFAVRFASYLSLACFVIMSTPCDFVIVFRKAVEFLNYFSDRRCLCALSFRRSLSFFSCRRVGCLLPNAALFTRCRFAVWIPSSPVVACFAYYPTAA